jgi:high affinity sulfate transporter 1
LKFRNMIETIKNQQINSKITKYFPILSWLPKYQLSWLRADIIAGLTVWAVMVPEAMAYAGIAGVPPLIGLYTVPFPLFFYALLGTSRLMVVGPDSATALISSVTVAALATSGSQEYLILTSAIAFTVGILFLMFGILKMGWVANFIPNPVMKGFIQGLVWVTIIGQVPKILGIEGGSGNFWQRLATIIRHLPQTNITTAVIGIGSIVILFVLKEYFPKIPSALTTAVVAILAVTFLGLEDTGLELIGSLDASLPPLNLPMVSMEQIKGIIGGAFAIVLIGYAETLGSAKAAAEKTGEEIDPNQELISLGPANLAAGLSSGFLVVGSLSKTSISMSSGGKTQVSSIVHGIFVLLTLLFLMPLFSNLPHATLAAIVIEAMLGLANISYFKNLRRIRKIEHAVALLAFFGVLFVGVLEGISLGVIAAILLLIHRASHPDTAVLGQIPQAQMYRDLALHPEAITFPGLLIFRFGTGLIFANANYFRNSLKQKIRDSTTPVKTVLIDAEMINLIDATSLEMLDKLRSELAKENIVLSWARLRDPLYTEMRKAGLVEEMGESNFYGRITDGVRAFVAAEKNNGNQLSKEERSPESQSFP